MKKILSILCAITLFMSMTVVAFAAEDETADDVVDASESEVVDATGDETDVVTDVIADAEVIAQQLVVEINKLLDKAGAGTLGDYIDQIISTIAQKTGVALDVSEIKAALAEKGIDVDSIKVVTAGQMDDLTQAIFDTIEEKYGPEAVNNFYELLKNSGIVNWFANLYVQTPDETTTVVEETTVEESEETTTEPVAPEEVPATGEASIVASVAVLAVAVGAAVICTKKAKKEEE